MSLTLTKKPALIAEVKRTTMEKLQKEHEVATRMCDGEEGYLDVSVFDDDVVKNIAQTIECEPQDIEGNLLVLSVID